MTLGPSVREALLIAAVSVALALAVNGIRPDGLDLFGAGAPPPAGNAPDAAGRELSIDEARQAHLRGDAVFADARAPADFAAGHIDGAVNLPEHDLEAWVEGFIARTEPQALIITYCDGGDCPLAKSLAGKLLELGFANTRYLSDGWGKWREQGLPTARGE